jgi:hypothetical protein
MRCPKCEWENFETNRLCARCGFQGNAARLEELGHLQWMLKELNEWEKFDTAVGLISNLKEFYSDRLKQTQIDLGLRSQPFTALEAAKSWPALTRLELLFDKVDEWSKAGYLISSVHDPLQTQRAHAQDLLQRLEGHPRPNVLETDHARLDVINFLLDNIDLLHSKQWFRSKDAREMAAAPLQDERHALQVRLGLISTPVEAEVERVVQAESIPAVSPPVVRQAAPPSRPMRERFWSAVLSERTLQGLIFLGIFLLFTAAISFVIWGWKDFSAVVRVAIPTGFTILFFVLGWWVQNKTKLARSGIALSAIGALFIPIDCYITFFTYTDMEVGWGNFWFWTSLICLVAYVLSTLWIQSRFFGYLTGVALGSLGMAALEITRNFTHISRDWFTASVSIAAAGMIILAARLTQMNEAGRWRIFAEPFRYLGLIIPGVLMPLTLLMRLTSGSGFGPLHYAMTINWFIGAFIFGWGAIYHRSRSLGVLAAISLPISVYMGQAGLFHNAGINPAWHAFGMACLVPVYLYSGRKLLDLIEDPILHAHGRTAATWGAALMIFSALYSLTDLTSGAPAAASHMVLMGSAVLAAILWQRPQYLYAASFFSFTSLTFVMTELELNLSNLSVGWISLALVHILLALYLGNRITTDGSMGVSEPINYLYPLVAAGYGIAGLALLPPLIPYDADKMTYALGNWLLLSLWGAQLAYKRTPGFAVIDTEKDLFTTGAIYHWFAAVALPLWLWILHTNLRPADGSLVLAFAALAWGMIFAAHWLRFTDRMCRIVWREVGLAVSLAAVIMAFAVAPHGYIPAIVLLLIGLLYFADAVSSLQSAEFYAAGLVTAWGWVALLNEMGWEAETITFSLCLLILVYFLAGLESERRRIVYATPKFLAPLYHTAHLLSLLVLAYMAIKPILDFLGLGSWTEHMQLWGAANLICLTAAYALFAWGRYQERWAHVAAWLGFGAGGLIAIVYSKGHGSSATIGAVTASLFILVERGLYYLKSRPESKRREQARARLVWVLFRRPLLVTGWIASAGTIGLALIQNLLLLGGGRIQQTWAAIGLTVITVLYALSARMFRMARFVWLAAFLSFIPWTIYHNLGWFTSYKPSPAEFAIAWTILAWISFVISLFLKRITEPAYVLPLKTFTHVLLPFSMLWAVADTNTSLITVGLSIALYATSAWLTHQRIKLQTESISSISATRFLYPALALIPLWFVYLLDWLLGWPLLAARHEHFGLILLPFGIIGLIVGLRLERIAPHPELQRAYGMPAFIVGYGSLIVGTLLTAHIPGLLVMTLLYDALLLAASARIFRNPLWVYPASMLGALAFAIALGEGGIRPERQGWWLIGLAANYLLIGWALRRIRLSGYAAPVMAVGFALIAFGLPPSSRDQVGAIWGYAGAALLYTICAFWLRQPLLLVPACVLVLVPYAVSLERSDLQTYYYGLALLPGAVIALGLGWLADMRHGTWKDFPWNEPADWPRSFMERLLHWWGFAPYSLGFGLAFFAPFFNGSRSDLQALTLVFLTLICAWAIFRFRLRGWLFAALLTFHLAVIQFFQHLEWHRLDPQEWWLRFMPLTLAMAALGLIIEKRFNERTPFREKGAIGWSHVFYLFLVLDMLFGQADSLNGTYSGLAVTASHMLICAVLASIWMSNGWAILSTFLGFVAVLQWHFALDTEIEFLPVMVAALGFGYGSLGLGYKILKQNPDTGAGQEAPSLGPQWLTIWENPLSVGSLVLSLLSMLLAFVIGFDLTVWMTRALFGIEFRSLVEFQTIWMMVWVLSLTGLLYALAAGAYQQVRVGYLAMAFLLAAWYLYAFFINAWDNLRLIQWYALPVGLYLLGIAFIEWNRGNKLLARWLDYAALLLMLGSLFWQTWLFGWLFALMLLTEGLTFLFLLGISRQLRRFFYAGLIGVMLAVLGQLLNAQQHVNQWLIFGIIGLLMISGAIAIERNMEAIKTWRDQVLETWE